jgi:hypothetical protein
MPIRHGKNYLMRARRKAIEMSSPTADARGQYARSQADPRSTGVASAKPTAITGSEDATAHKTPPGKNPVKEWEVGYDPSEMNEGSFRGHR